MATDSNAFEGWCIIEQMGHKRMAGYVSEQVIGGYSFIRVDVPGPDGQGAATQFITGQTVYAITPCTEDIARKVAANCQPSPVTIWDLKTPALPAARCDDDDTDEYDEDDMP